MRKMYDIYNVNFVVAIKYIFTVFFVRMSQRPKHIPVGTEGSKRSYRPRLVA